VAWQDRRNTVGRTVDLQLTTVHACIKLKRLYPTFRSNRALVCY
jgi:hypothetical protein